MTSLLKGRHRRMSSRRSRSTLKSLLATLTLRGTALGGRFVFVVFAAKYMLPEDFGRFGLLAGLALLIPVVVGFEAYQVLLRRILQEPDRASDTRRFYAIFIVAGSLVSGTAGAVTLFAFGWPTREIALGAVVLCLEHIGLETSRNLINERLPALAVFSVALRTGAWGIAVPVLFFFGLVQAPWTFETILWLWIAGAAGAALTGLPVWPLFRPRKRDLRSVHFQRQLFDVTRRSWTWVVFTTSLRLIETGGRFVCAWMLSEAAAGRFTFVSMLASLSYVAQKGIVEPIYSPRLSTLDATERTYRDFRRINYLVIAGGTLCSTLGLAASTWLTGAVPPGTELTSFGLLCFAFACLSLAQPAHYRLYRGHKDKVIMTTGVVACCVMLASSTLLAFFWGIAGAAGGVFLGALVLLILKARAAGKLLLGPGEN